MAIEVVMPQMGESIFEGTVTKWLKKPGESVQRDEPLFEISTDKVDAEIQSPATGVLKEIKVTEGQTVPIRTVVALIEDAAAATGADSSAQKIASPPPAAPKSPSAPATPQASSTETPSTTSSAGEETGPITPLVQRLARENNVDLTKIKGTGAGGRITKQDVLAAAEKKAAPAPPSTPAAATPPPSPASAAPPSGSAPVAHVTLESAVPRERIYFGKYEIQPMNIMRQRIAEHMVASKHVSPHVYSLEEAEMTRVIALRNSAKDEFEKRNGAKLTFMPFFVRACAEALRAFPIVNASIDGTNIVMHSEINIGIAVALDPGLIVPVLKNADQKNFTDLQRAINDLAERARGKKLQPDEVHESTFSITNPGVFGGLMGLPIINQPNVAILAIGAIQKRAVVLDDDALAARSMVYVTLSYDHRVVDGAVSHRFLARIKQRLEQWDEQIV